MRIGIDVTPLAGQRTGVGRYTHYLLQHLAAHADADTLHGLSTGTVKLDARDRQLLTEHKHLPLPTRVMYALWNATRLPRADALLGGVDVYHATNYFLPPLASARSVVTIHDLAFLRNPEWGSPKIIKTFSQGVQRFAQQASAVAACSEATKKDIVELLEIDADKVSVIYEAADETFTSVDRDAARDDLARLYGIAAPILLFVGTIEPRKNIEGLLRAFAQVHKEIPHQLVLVGKHGWGPATVPEMADRLGIRERVLPIGFVSHEELIKFYSASNAFVFPSFYEGFGLPVLEAMRCGAPVITSNVSSLPEVAGDAAEYVDPADVNELAQAIQRVALDPTLRASMRERGVAQVKRFSWAQCAQQTHDLYRSLL